MKKVIAPRLRVALLANWLLTAGYASGFLIVAVYAAGTETMNDTQQQVIRLLTLPDQEYFKVDTKRLLDLQLALAALFAPKPMSGPPMEPTEPAAKVLLALAAPRTVTYNPKGDLPLLVASHRNGVREWQVRRETNTRLVVIELQTGEFTSDRPANPGKREMTPEPSMSGAPPDAINAAALTSAVERFDLRRSLEIDWRPTRLALTVIEYDQRSNTMVVNIQGDEEDTTQMSLGRASPYLRPFSPDQPIPALVDTGMHLELPRSGIADQPLPVVLTFDLPRGNQPIIMDREKRAPLLKTTLLLLRLDDEQPIQIDLQVPVNMSKPMFGEPRLRGAVRFDLRTATERTLAGTYQVYLLAGDRVIGPQPILLD